MTKLTNGSRPCHFGKDGVSEARPGTFHSDREGHRYSNLRHVFAAEFLTVARCFVFVYSTPPPRVPTAGRFTLIGRQPPIRTSMIQMSMFGD